MDFTTCVNCGAKKVDGVECPLCHAIYERAERIHEKRQQAKEQQSEQAKQEKHKEGDNFSSRLKKGIAESPILAHVGFTIDCQACKLSGGMEKGRVHRFPLLIRLIGWMIATPSAVGMLVGLIVVFMDKKGAAGVETMGFFVGGGFFMLSAVAGLVGWLLLMRKKAWVCRRCGYLMDRA